MGVSDGSRLQTDPRRPQAAVSGERRFFLHKAPQAQLSIGNPPRGPRGGKTREAVYFGGFLLANHPAMRTMAMMRAAAISRAAMANASIAMV
jgi:hypothetical protein